MVHLKSILILKGLGLVVVLLMGLTLLYNNWSVSPRIAAAAPPDFGSNVTIFDPGMPVSQIQATIDAITSQQVNSEMGSQRYSLLFKPGTYGSAGNPLNFQIGYYTEVAGLGQSPTDVVINGRVEVYNRCLTPDNCLALVNFWRSLSNLTINVAALPGCRGDVNFWAVSQAAPMRRVNINGKLSLMDYCTAGPQYASGGYMADTQTNNSIVSGSQQQFFVRDGKVGGWSNGVWNMVFAGVVGAPANSFSTTNTSNTQPYTTLPTNPVSQEKPYLYVDGSDNYNVFVPALRTNAVGASWANGPTPGITLPISSFFIAKPTDSAATINAALTAGKNLIFTPGIYQIDATIQINRADTIVLGLGLATLVPNNGVVAMAVGNVPGVKIGGILFDAGLVNSPVLLQVGTTTGVGVSTNPTLIQDVFFRIGGAFAGKATTSLVVNTDYTLIDHIWAWRGDHGSGIGWDSNTADTGVIVNGNNVTATGLFVEHYQKYQVIWNGENGRTIFFQSEMPYDPPNQAAWMNGSTKGYASYKVADNVQNHEAWGLGSYCYFNVDPTVHATRGFEVPDRAGIRLFSLLTVSLGGVGVIDHVINNTGGPAQGVNTVPVNIVSYVATSLNLIATPNPANFGQAVTFTATVLPANASGTVTFTFNGITQTTATLAGGVATYMTNTLPFGVYTVTATYGGNIDYIGNTTNLLQNICNPLMVTATSDNGQANLCGTFSYALLSASSGTTITFAIAQGNMITLTGALTPTLKAGVVIDGGANVDGVVLNGNTVAGAGLTLGGNNTLLNLTIRGFNSKGLVANTGGNKLYMVKVLKNL